MRRPWLGLQQRTQDARLSDVPESHGKYDTGVGMDERRTTPEDPAASLRQLVIELPLNLDDVRLRTDGADDADPLVGFMFHARRSSL
jgi:hypothetical protein